jgi:hypothetical protein
MLAIKSLSVFNSCLNIRMIYNKASYTIKPPKLPIRIYQSNITKLPSPDTARNAYIPPKLSEYLWGRAPEVLEAVGLELTTLELGDVVGVAGFTEVVGLFFAALVVVDPATDCIEAGVEGAAVVPVPAAPE